MRGEVALIHHNVGIAVPYLTSTLLLMPGKVILDSTNEPDITYRVIRIYAILTDVPHGIE